LTAHPRKSDSKDIAAASATVLDRIPMLRQVGRIVDYCVPTSCRRDPELLRRCRLLAHFGVQGTFFGALYCAFYLAIGHIWGMAIIAMCTAVFAWIPIHLRRSGNITCGGHVLAATMCAGFLALAMVEGGIHGHAVAWLSSVPLCALLVLGLRGAAIWIGVSFLSAGAVVAASICGWYMPTMYDPRWSTLVDSAGNLGLIFFLFVLGLVFEVNRSQAFDRMQESLGELAASNEELVHLNNEKTEFLGIAAHDLKNPLTAIIGFSSLLAQNRDEKVSRQGKLIAKGGTQMLQLIGDLLDANAIAEGRYATDIQSCDLTEIVAESVQRNEAAAAKKDSIFLVCADGPLIGHADRKATLQILDNLLSNALKFSPIRCSVRIHLLNENGFSMIAIEDQGPGISEEDQQKLFQKYTRLSARPTAGETSTGLGLSIVKRLAEAMGGDVICRSKLGEGSTFTLRLRNR
jgi:signal transduction histidine kinase